MKIISRIKSKVGLSKNKGEDERDENENKNLDKPRQFIYLDELSVESLLASKGEGGIISQMTKEGLSETSEELKGDVNASIAGVGSKVSGSKLEKNSQRTASVNHFNLIQSQFTRLYKSDKIQFKTLEEGVDTEDIDRGDILKIEANISVNKLYQTSKTFEYLDDLFPSEISDNHQVRNVMEKLSSLFEESIPVVGEATRLELEEDDQIKTNENPKNPLTLVGNLEHELLWADPAKSLYSKEEFVVVCRVKAIKEYEDTKSLKISEIIDPLMPKTASSFEQEMENAVDAIETQLSEYDAINAGQSEGYLSSYSETLQEKYTEVEETTEQELMQKVLQKSGNLSRQQEKQYRKDLTEEFTDLYEEETGVSIKPEERIDIRGDIEQDASDFEIENDETAGKVIDSEIIAIYW